MVAEKVATKLVTIRYVHQDGRQKCYCTQHGSFFGSLEAASGPNDCGLVQDGEVRMKVLAEPGGQLQFRAFAMDGQQLAAGGCVGGEWRLQVRANADAILITSCILAMIFFTPAARSSIVPTPVSAARSPQATPQAVSRSPPLQPMHRAPGPPSRTSPQLPGRRP